MKRRIESKHIISVIAAVATVLSLGCLALADETDDQAAAVELTEEAVPEDDGTADDEVQVVISYSVEETVTDEVTNAKNGWDEYSTGKWRYYENGSYVKGWKEIGSKWYWFDSDGVMFTGQHYDNTYKATYIFGLNGAMLTNRWQQYDGSWYYLNGNGKAVKGWKQIDGSWYYFADSQTPGMYKNGVKQIGNYWYMFARNGKMLTGWQETKYGWMFFNEKTGRAAEGWEKIEGKWYYFNLTSGIGPIMVKDDIILIENSDGSSSWYGLDENGVLMKAGWYNDHYVEVDKKKVANGNWYYFDSKGRAATGWQTIGGVKYYFGDGKTDPYAVINMNKIDGKYYFFDPATSGLITNKWIDTYSFYSVMDGYHNYVYAGSDGALYTGWKTIDGKTYYFGDDNSRPSLKTGFIRVNNERFFLGEDGVLRNGWFVEDGERFYAGSKGVLVENEWKIIGGKTYFFTNGGAAATGLRKISGVLYNFDDNGVCTNPPSL